MGNAGKGIALTGDDVLDELLRGMPLKVQKKVSRQATRRAATEIVLPSAKDRVGVWTGDLEESLTVRATTRSRSRFGHEVRTREGFWKGDEFYGAYLELGTKERRHKSGKSVGAITPRYHSYLRPAVYDNEDRIRALYVSAMKEFIRELPKIK